MFKLKTIIATFIIGLCIVGQAYAASNVSIRISKPKTPTNLNTFDISVVTLDILNNPITVRCFKKSPSDAGFSQFGGDIALIAGGNSTLCPVTSSIIGDTGTYQFYATSQAGAESATSETVSVEYKTSGPDTPNYNGKERVNICDYKIKFHTADDGGKTIKVEVYRSENTSFTADGGTKVDTITIASNTDGYSITTPPTCTKEYYFAIRSFDSIGNGSGIAGDSVTHTSTTTVLPTTATQNPATGAIPLILGGGSVLGDTTKDATKTGEGKVLGEEASPSPKLIEIQGGTSFGSFIKKTITNPFVIAGVLLLAIGAIFYARKNK
jgi:hypothetical protein